MGPQAAVQRWMPLLFKYTEHDASKPYIQGKLALAIAIAEFGAIKLVRGWVTFSIGKEQLFKVKEMPNGYYYVTDKNGQMYTAQGCIPTWEMALSLKQGHQYNYPERDVWILAGDLDEIVARYTGGKPLPLPFGPMSDKDWKAELAAQCLADSK